MSTGVEHSPQLGCAVLFFLCRLQAVRFAPTNANEPSNFLGRGLL